MYEQFQTLGVSVGPILIQIGLSALLCREHHLRAIQVAMAILGVVESKNLHVARLLEPMLSHTGAFRIRRPVCSVTSVTKPLITYWLSVPLREKYSFMH